MTLCLTIIWSHAVDSDHDFWKSQHKAFLLHPTAFCSHVPTHFRYTLHCEWSSCLNVYRWFHKCVHKHFQHDFAGGTLKKPYLFIFFWHHFAFLYSCWEEKSAKDLSFKSTRIRMLDVYFHLSFNRREKDKRTTPASLWHRRWKSVQQRHLI